MTTRQTVFGTGSLQNVVLEFDYINQSHVKVSVNGTPLAYSWVNPTTVQFTAASGQPVTVYRETPKDTPLVEFSSTNSVGSPELNLVARQALFAAQEVQDVADEAVIKGLAGKSDVGHGHDHATTSAPGFMSAADKTKLDGVSAGATANDTDAELRDRSTHTGTQSADTISDLSERIQDVVGSALIGGSNVTVSYNDAAGTITLSATGDLAADWNTIVNLPATFPPGTHGHTIAEITSLQTALDAKLPLSGGTVTGGVVLAGGATVSGRDLYGANAFAATGGNEADIDLGEQIRLSVTFTATGKRGLFSARCFTEHVSGGANTIEMVLEVYDNIAGVPVGRDICVGASVPGTFGPSLVGLFSMDNFTVGRSYTAKLNLRKFAATGPIYPRGMRIAGIMA